MTSREWLFFVFNRSDVGGTLSYMEPFELEKNLRNQPLILGLLRDWVGFNLWSFYRGSILILARSKMTMTRSSGSSRAFTIELCLSFMVSLFLDRHYVPSCICLHLSRFPLCSSRFDTCLFFILLPPTRKLSLCLPKSTFIEIRYLGWG